MNDTKKTLEPLGMMAPDECSPPSEPDVCFPVAPHDTIGCAPSPDDDAPC